MIEKDIVKEGLRRTKIDEYLESKLERAGYGGMDIQVTPLGTMIVVYAEKPGMVIGRGGKTVRGITETLKEDFKLDNPQVDVKEVDVPELNPKIMASKIASMLQRGMHFRRVAYSNIRRIMGAGAQGVEVTISGKIRGSRSAVAKFVEGYIKKCGEPSIRLVKEGFSTVQLKPGVLGIFVRIMPPDANLPDKVEILPPQIDEVTEDESIEMESTEDIEVVEDLVTDGLEQIEDIDEIEDIEDLEEIDAENDIDDIDDLEEIEDSHKLEEVQEKVTEDTPKAEEVEDIKDLDELETVGDEN
ncbi:MAG: 30S ribosomal protein S3 [Methanobrevibacter sp.]|jgi:small subunit ribosomal protein S3|nr:30S ribosomal protein S3 [Candidatus Methanoflexus mossambicus]